MTKIICYITLLLLAFTSCSEKYVWHEDKKNNCRLYTLNDADYEWDGNVECGVAHGAGFLIKDGWFSSESTASFAYYGIVYPSKDGIEEFISSINSLQSGQCYKFGDSDDDGYQGFYAEFAPSYTYIGYCEDNKWNGYGYYFYEGVLYYEGEFKDGTYHGYGKFYENGELTFEGQFEDGQAVSGVLYDNESGEGSIQRMDNRIWDLTYGNIRKHKWALGLDLYDEISTHAEHFLNNKTKYYIGIGIPLLIILLIFWSISVDEFDKGPRILRKSYLYLLLGWPIGLHNAYLHHEKVSVLKFLGAMYLVFANRYNICLYIMYPSTWLILPYFSKETLGVAGLIGLLTLIDIILIPYYVKRSN